MKGTATKHYSVANKSLTRRYQISKDFIDKHFGPNDSILDLGINNPFSEMLRDQGFKVTNTAFGQDLDNDYEIVKSQFDGVTALQILEHLVAPYNILKEIKAPKLIASVPLQLWFTKAYWSENDEWDRHFHEFESRQFDMLLDKAGWQIKDSCKWKSYTNKIGIRPLLRRFYDRYYMVYCERK
jgi:hypothetical protein